MRRRGGHGVLVEVALTDAHRRRLPLQKLLSRCGRHGVDSSVLHAASEITPTDGIMNDFDMHVYSFTHLIS